MLQLDYNTVPLNHGPVSDWTKYLLGSLNLQGIRISAKLKVMAN